MSDVDGLLSDLFFNWGPAEAAYGDCFAAEEAGSALEVSPLAAVELVAAEFLDQYKELFNCDIPTSMELAQDFIDRV